MLHDARSTKRSSESRAAKQGLSGVSMRELSWVMWFESENAEKCE